MCKKTWTALMLLICCFASALTAAEETNKAAAKDPAKDKPKDGEEKLVETKHKVTIAGKEISYTARAGTIFLRDAEEKPTAAIFYIAYTRDGVKELSARPVTFSFNGGPGSSSVWMHLGLLGPRRVLVNDDGTAVPPPYKLVDNEFSLLDETDLVFIDPVSTGYSRATKPDDAHKFHGLREDTASVGEFIRLYVTRNQRWLSPKFIIGESYGTTRAAALSGELAGRQRMNVNGIMLVSTVLNFQTIDFEEGNDLPYILYLPSYTANAWFHKKLPADLQQLSLKEVLAQAETFAAGDYNSALLRGSSLAPAERQKIVTQMARLTGLSTNLVDRANLRLRNSQFSAELLADEARVLGRFDGRYTGLVRDRLARHAGQDPSFEAVHSAFASTFNHYIRAELKYETDQSYEIIAGVGPWNWGEKSGYVNVAETLANAMTYNPFLKVYVACGAYDLATPYFAARYTFSHLGTDPSLAKNITLEDYTAGHMMYMNLPDLKKQKADLTRFLRAASAGQK